MPRESEGPTSRHFEELEWLRARVHALEGAMQEFVDRVDRGEVRSVYTVQKFRNLLHGPRGENR